MPRYAIENNVYLSDRSYQNVIFYLLAAIVYAKKSTINSSRILLYLPKHVCTLKIKILFI